MNHLPALHHLLTLLPLQVVLGGLVPILQFAQQRLIMRHAEQRKQGLQTRLVALHPSSPVLRGCMRSTKLAGCAWTMPFWSENMP
jgi:hypothetical protein